MIEENLEQFLQELYIYQFEQGGYPQEQQKQKVITGALDQKFVERKNDSYELTQAGIEAATDVVRRHRLAERLLADVLQVSKGIVHDQACTFEHVLEAEVTEKVCELLGHPSTCPHGRAIPKGSCCKRHETDKITEVSPLSKGKVGGAGRVAYLSTRDNREVQKLMAMSVLPGTDISLIRKFPSYVFQIGYSQFTVDKELASLIYVHWNRSKGTDKR